MDIFSIVAMAGGLALFLFGMDFMGSNLSRASGGKMEQILEKLTGNPLKAVALGAAVTAFAPVLGLLGQQLHKPGFVLGGVAGDFP